MSETTDVTQLVQAALHQPSLLETKDGRVFILRPSGPDAYAIDNITPTNAQPVLMPKVITQLVAVQTAGSLKTYLKRFKNDDSMIFADIDANRIVGAIDYHQMPVAPEEAKVALVETSGARLGVHTATLALPFSKEWDTWIKANEKLMSHVEFANFLEENVLDVTIPDGAELLEICRDLQVTSNKHFEASVRMGDRVSFTYKKDEDAVTTSEMDLPIEFTIRIPVYYDERPIMIRCMTRRKIADGDLFLGYKMLRVEQTRQAEFQRIASEVQFDTSLTMVNGRRGQ